MKIKNEALVSIVIPIYNAELYLRRCLDSIVSQTYRKIEVICVDDGSTDNSVSIINKYIADDARIRLICQKNQYAGVARNTGLKEVSGEYVMFLDADDFFSDRLIETLYKDIEDNNADIVICDERAFYEETDKEIMFSTYSPLLENLNIMKTFCPHDYPQYIFNISETHVWDKLFRTDFIRDNGIQFQNSRVINDALFCQLAMALADKIVINKEKLVTYRIHFQNSLSSSRFSEWRSAYEMLDSLKNELQSRGVYEEFEQSYINYAASVVGVYLMSSITDAVYFSKAFEYYKKIGMDKYGFLRYSKSYFYNQDVYDIISRLDKMDEIEFLCSRVMDLKKKEREILDLNLDIFKLKFLVDNFEGILSNKKWAFPRHLIPSGSRVALYGYGEIGKEFREDLQKDSNYKLIAIADRNYRELSGADQKIISMDEIVKCDWDFIVVAQFDEKVAEGIRKQLVERGISSERIIWNNPLKKPNN